MATWWYVQYVDGNRTGPQSGAYRTRAEARFRLEQIANEITPVSGPHIVRESHDIVAYSDGQEYRVVKV